MIGNAVALPVLIPLVTALTLLALGTRRRAAEAVSMASALGLLAVAIWLVARAAAGGLLALPVGAWAPGVGILWVVDRLSALMLLLAAVSNVATLVYAPAALRDPRARRWFPALHQVLLLGVNGALVTADLFNLFVFFEVLLVASFVLLVLGRRAGSAFPYVIVNLAASALLFGGVGVVYATAGTVTMPVLAETFAGPRPPVFWAGAALVVLAFAVKAAVVPLHAWLPDSYPEAPLPVSAFFAGLLTKVGVYALFRAVTLFAAPMPGLLPLLLALSAATMVLGVLGALGRSTLRGILSFHIISQVGYMVFGLALFTRAGIAAGLFYVAHHIVVKTALFLVAGLVERLGGGGLGDVTGLARARPWAGVAFLVPALALAGLPPLSGFAGKLLLIIAGVEARAPVATGAAVVVSLLTLASMAKIWFATFWGAPGRELPRRRGERRLLGPALGLAGLSVGIGAAAPAVYAYTSRTADELMAPADHARRILAEAWRAPALRARETP